MNGYYRSDGTYVEGYRRGGVEGYKRSDPDQDTANNLNQEDTYVEGYETPSFSETITESLIDSILGD
ncbi:hypothetical protein [Paenisporosarcina sp. NPDC076898]|uniref:hypothetical protein n=1 Tax=unclassified Paenisporosarcina TaxID=2642018 RepID=UPI003D03A4AC